MPAAGQFEAGESALAKGRWEDARGSFEAALVVEQTPEAHEDLAWAAVWTNWGDAAIPRSTMRTGRSAEPDYAWLPAFGGMSALKSGDTAAAVELGHAAQKWALREVRSAASPTAW